tara:strand:- start:13553 stop:14155 length:603 start_codon:yes stop_codon:yes gene_type:complete
MNQLLLHNGIDVDPFPKLIWKFKYNFPYDSLSSLINELKSKTPKNSKLEAGAAFSTAPAKFDPPHTWPELQDFRQWIGEPLDFLWNHFNFNSYSGSTVTNSWINTHEKGGSTLEHNHNFSLFVVTAYLKLPKDSGFIEFRDPLEYHKNNTPIEPEEELWKSVPCETNDILIFPGWLKHRVPQSNTNEERVVLTMNIGPAV